MTQQHQQQLAASEPTSRRFSGLLPSEAQIWAFPLSVLQKDKHSKITLERITKRQNFS
ncbi:unnamed protein product [Larinioides sclopetarius]|uniref:Uncharacterized protein n=1 Tax=Larinioides sclopetarius TaxID=280406 RepID=A0AAV1ZT17_9ARAC